MADVWITPAQTEREILEFIQFPWEVYKNDRHWVPPLISERRSFLDRSKNPFFQHARAEYFLARRDGKVVGTIGAFTNDRYNEFQEVNTGFFGFFEVLDDPEAARALLATAEAWARQAGHKTILGPAQFSTNDEVGLLVDGFDDAPRILMTYNPRIYADYLEAAGYRKAMDLWAYQTPLSRFDSDEGFPPKLLRVAEKVRQRGKLHVRRLNMKEFDREVEQVKRVYNRSWERNWGFVPMTDPEFDHLGKQLKAIIDPELVVIVEADGEMVGFGLTLPDLSEPLRLAYPRPGALESLTTLKLLWHWKVRRRVRWIRVLALGVLPEYRGQGVDALMYLETARSGARRGYQKVEMSWILENNMMMNRGIRFMGGEVYKTYRLYDKRV
ncbi:MAG TPA: GNAT family N-acetyltransferase [Anaerolineales bacterium]|nr:GNAT family N-acetyltransferase [Anaerolineales bacterium]